MFWINFFNFQIQIFHWSHFWANLFVLDMLLTTCVHEYVTACKLINCIQGHGTAVTLGNLWQPLVTIGNLG